MALTIPSTLEPHLHLIYLPGGGTAAPSKASMQILDLPTRRTASILADGEELHGVAWKKPLFCQIIQFQARFTNY
jgi:hypothetical protein